MAVKTKSNKKVVTLNEILKEIQEVKSFLKKLLLVIPEESLKEYQNKENIKKAYLDALKHYPPA